MVHLHTLNFYNRYLVSVISLMLIFKLNKSSSWHTNSSLKDLLCHHWKTYYAMTERHTMLSLKDILCHHWKTYYVITERHTMSLLKDILCHHWKIYYVITERHTVITETYYVITERHTITMSYLMFFLTLN